MTEKSPNTEKKSEKEISIILSPNEIALVINSLSEKSFKDVYSLIGKIHSQANCQV